MPRTGVFTPPLSSCVTFQKGRRVIFCCVLGYKRFSLRNLSHTMIEQCCVCVTTGKKTKHSHPHQSQFLDRQTTFHRVAATTSECLPWTLLEWTCNFETALSRAENVTGDGGLECSTSRYSSSRSRSVQFLNHATTVICLNMTHIFLADKQIPSVIITNKSPQTKPEGEKGETVEKIDFSPVKMIRQVLVLRLGSTTNLPRAGNFLSAKTT